MTEQINSQMNQRPTFLTVLCAITFVVSGWTIFSGLNSYLNADEAAGSSELVREAMEDAMDDIDTDNLSEEDLAFIESMVENFSDSFTPAKIRKGGMVNLVSSLLTIAGAFLMWRLNKQGFYLYIVGIVVLLAGILVVYDGFMASIMVGFLGFFGLLFIILYGVNTKHMN